MKTTVSDSSRKKDHALVVLVKNLTAKQAGKMHADVVSSKNKHAPLSAGGSVIGKTSEVGRMLETGNKNIAKLPDKSGAANG